MEEKLLMAYNQQNLVEIKFTAKGAHKMLRENINSSLLGQGQVLKGRESEQEMVWFNGINCDIDRGKFRC